MAAYDAAGNVSAKSTGVSATTLGGTPYERTAPTVRITSPTANSTYSTSTSSLILAGTAADNTRLHR